MVNKERKTGKMEGLLGYGFVDIALLSSDS